MQQKEPRTGTIHFWRGKAIKKRRSHFRQLLLLIDLLGLVRLEGEGRYKLTVMAIKHEIFPPLPLPLERFNSNCRLGTSGDTCANFWVWYFIQSSVCTVTDTRTIFLKSWCLHFSLIKENIVRPPLYTSALFMLSRSSYIAPKRFCTTNRGQDVMVEKRVATIKPTRTNYAH